MYSLPPRMIKKSRALFDVAYLRRLILVYLSLGAVLLSEITLIVLYLVYSLATTAVYGRFVVLL